MSSCNMAMGLMLDLVDLITCFVNAAICSIRTTENLYTFQIYT